MLYLELVASDRLLSKWAPVFNDMGEGYTVRFALRSFLGVTLSKNGLISNERRTAVYWDTAEP